MEISSMTEAEAEPNFTFSFVTKDGTPSPRVNPDSQQKLLTAMHKYKTAFESTRSKEATLRQPLELARNALVSIVNTYAYFTSRGALSSHILLHYITHTKGTQESRPPKDAARYYSCRKKSKESTSKSSSSIS